MYLRWLTLFCNNFKCLSSNSHFSYTRIKCSNFHFSSCLACLLLCALSPSSCLLFALSLFLLHCTSRLSSSNEKMLDENFDKRKEKVDEKTTTTIKSIHYTRVEMMMMLMMVVADRKENERERANGQRWGHNTHTHTHERWRISFIHLNQSMCTKNNGHKREASACTDIHVTRSLRIYWTRLKTWSYVDEFSFDLVYMYSRSVPQGHFFCHKHF